MKLIRKLLVKIIGLENYLRLVSKVYLMIINLGLYKKKYAELHFIKSIIREDDTVVDIGANLGYYSFFMAKKLNNNGRLIAVEPIPLFAKVWQSNLNKFLSSKITLHNCALGNENLSSVKMSIPIVNGVVRHGLTKVNSDFTENEISFEIPMKIGDEVISKDNIKTINYIKCDVEGYEQFVIPSLTKNINAFKPIIQIELNGEENRNNVANFLVDINYSIYILVFNKLKEISLKEIHTFNQDFYFIHPDKMDEYSHLIK